MARLGVMIEAQEGLTWDRWSNLIDATDRLGFEGLWRSDHLFSVMGEGRRDSLALWPSLTMVALRSQRIRFGQLVSPITFRHPVLLARNAAALDRLSGGRFALGIGAGWNESEHDAFGFPLPPPRERIDQLDEAIQVITRLWTGDPVSFDGRYYQLHDAQMRPTPEQPGRVPLIVGAKRGKRMLRIVADYANDWNITGSGLSHEEYRELSQTLERFCQRSKRDPKSIQRSIMLTHLVGRDEQELRERAARLKQIVTSMTDVPVEKIPETARARGWLVGTPEEVVQGINGWQSVGIERIMLQTFDQEDIGALELIASEVMPQVSPAAEKYATGPSGDGSS